MRDSLLRFSNTGAGIKPAVCLLPAQAMLIGIFSGFFDITAHSMFLSFFDEKMMARAYIFSGITGLILSYLFLVLISRMPFKKLSVINLLFVSMVTLVLWILLIVKPSASVVFVLFIMMGPLNILAILGLDRTILNLTDKDRNGSLSGVTGAALIIGIMSGSFSIPVLLNTSQDLRYFILFGFLAAMGAFVIQISLWKIFNSEDYNLNLQDTLQKKDSSFLILPENTLHRRVAIVAVFSVITAFFVQYSFLAVARIQYPTMQDLAHFLGLFTGILMTIALIIKLLVFTFLIRNFRLRATIILPPLIIALLTIGVLATGYINGNNSAAAGITGFFILLAMSRLFSRSFKETVELSSAEVICQSLDENQRLAALSGIRGTVNEAGTIIAGVILTCLGIIGSVKLIHFPVVLIILTILWIISAFRLYSAYRDSVRTDEKRPGNTGSDEVVEKIFPVWENRLSAEMAFADDFYDLITGDPGIPEKSHNQWYLNKILDYAGIKKDINLLPALKKIRSGSTIPRETKQRASEIIQDLELLLSGVRNRDERLKAMLMLSDERSPHIPEVLKLLRDQDNDLKIIALSMIRKFRLSELLPEVCGCLNNNFVAVHAENVLKSFGSEADQPLQRFYLLSTGDIRISASILKILGGNCSSENTGFLFSLLWTASRPIREAGLKSLAGCTFNIDSQEKEKLLRVINDVIGIITWNISAGICLGRKNSRLSADAMSQENRRWIDFLFNLLAVAYGKRIAGEIRESIDRGSFESVNHALEMIDIITDEQVRSRLTVLLDRIPENRKLRTLFRFYPGEIPEWEDLVGYIINRDYNLLGVWIRACIIRDIPEISGNDIAESLIALLFSPEEILREETAKLLSRSGKEYFIQASDRLPGNIKETLDSIISGNVKDYELLFNKVMFLKSLFNSLPEESLLILAGNMVSAGFLSPEYLPRENGYILWECDSGGHECAAGVFYDNILRTISTAGKDSFCYILPLADLEDFLARYPEHTPEIFKYIDETERRNQ